MSHRAVVERYLRAVERKNIRVLRQLLCHDVVDVELPNALQPAGGERTIEQMLDGVTRGAQVLREERYEVLSFLERGGKAACELRWTGTLAVPVLGKQPGEDLVASLAVFYTFRDGRIASTRHYDCFHLG